MKFVQIAVTSDIENGEVLYALSDDGAIYEKVVAIYSPGGRYDARSITRGRAVTSPFWRKVELPFVVPPLEEEKLRRLEFEEEA